MNQSIPDDIDALRPWFPAIRHCISVSKLSDCLAVVTLRIVVDEMGRPTPGLWILPTIDKLLPRATRDEALSELLSKLTES